MEHTITLYVNVTQEDIDEGEPGNCSKCPVALALWREIVTHPEYGIDKILVSHYDVDVHYVEWAIEQMESDWSSFKTYTFGDAVPDFIAEYDNMADQICDHDEDDPAHGVRPFRFTLRIAVPAKAS